MMYLLFIFAFIYFVPQLGCQLVIFAPHRSFQLLTQVSGRAGRGARPGVVVVQAYRPEHPALTAALTQDFRSFAEHEAAARTALRYPPAAGMAPTSISRLTDPMGITPPGFSL